MGVYSQKEVRLPDFCKPAQGQEVRVSHCISVSGISHFGVVGVALLSGHTSAVNTNMIYGYL